MATGLGRAAARRRAMEVLDWLGLAARAHRKVGHPALRRGAPGRHRPRRRHGAAIPADGRAGRRAERCRMRGPETGDRPHPARARLRHPADRAPHVADLRALRPHPCAAAGPHHRHRPPGRDPQRRRGAPGLSRRRGRSEPCWRSGISMSATAASSRCAASRSQVAEGEIVAVIGPNGAGKSTLLLTIAGMVRAKQGSIEFAGGSVDGQPRRSGWWPRGLSLVPEGRHIFGSLTVAENIALGATTRVGPGGDRSRHRSACWICSRCCRSACGSGRASSPAASSRCWRSRARCWRGRGCCCSTSRRSAWRRWS